MNTIRLLDMGILPNSDITLSLYDIISKNKKDTEFVFENADYYFSPHSEMHANYRLSNTDVLPYRVLGIWLKEHENCVINGNGAHLYFEGQMQPITLDKCRNITVKNLTVDWKKPLVAEGTVTAVGDSYADIYIDNNIFPHKFEDGVLWFDTGANEFYKLNSWGSIVFDENNNSVTRASGDFFDTVKQEHIGNNIYRFYSSGTSIMKVGSTVVLRHNARAHAGIFSEKGEDIIFSDITFHSCGGLGCLAQFCHNLTYKRVDFLPNRNAGRRVSNGRDDGMHLTCNSGHITVSECSFVGLMDDPINVHGCCVTSNEALDRRTLRCKYRHRQAKGFLYWAEEGDEISFIDRSSMSSIGSAVAKSYNLDSEQDDEFILVFNEDLPNKIIELANKGEALALDNITHTASFTCTKNRFGSCRARGILVSTPKKVVIRDNYFSSSGSAILVAGDSNYWFESGECRDVEISHNVFTDLCLSSMYQFCDGIISICPVVPSPITELPYHKNIKITENTFDSPMTPLLYAYSTDNLIFADNLIFVSPSAEKWHPSNEWIKLSFCKDSEIKRNAFIGLCDSFGLENHLSLDSCENIYTDR